MFQFKRGLSPKFVDLLNAEYEKDGWWKSIADDPSLFIGIRDEYLNVYWKGNSLLRLWPQGDTLSGSVHYKYLLRPEMSTSPYLPFDGSRIQLGQPADFFLADLSDLSALKRAADRYAGEEKTGVHNIAMSNPNIIDVEIAFGAENESPKTRDLVVQRIDFAAVTQGKTGPELIFYEAKSFSSPELRSNGKAASVVGQLERYQVFLRNEKAALIKAYRTVCANVLALRGVQDRFAPKRELLSGIAAGTVDFTINDDVRLVVFGFDSDQRDGTVWAEHRDKLKAALGERLLLKGSAKNFTRGISSLAQ